MSEKANYEIADVSKIITRFLGISGTIKPEITYKTTEVAVSYAHGSGEKDVNVLVDGLVNIFKNIRYNDDAQTVIRHPISILSDYSSSKPGDPLAFWIKKTFAGHAIVMVTPEYIRKLNDETIVYEECFSIFNQYERSGYKLIFMVLKPIEHLQFTKPLMSDRFVRDVLDFNNRIYVDCTQSLADGISKLIAILLWQVPFQVRTSHLEILRQYNDATVSSQTLIPAVSNEIDRMFGFAKGEVEPDDGDLARLRSSRAWMQQENRLGLTPVEVAVICGNSEFFELFDGNRQPVRAEKVLPFMPTETILGFVDVRGSINQTGVDDDVIRYYRNIIDATNDNTDLKIILKINENTRDLTLTKRMYGSTARIISMLERVIDLDALGIGSQNPTAIQTVFSWALTGLSDDEKNDRLLGRIQRFRRFTFLDSINKSSKHYFLGLSLSDQIQEIETDLKTRKLEDAAKKINQALNPVLDDWDGYLASYDRQYLFFLAACLEKKMPVEKINLYVKTGKMEKFYQACKWMRAGNVLEIEKILSESIDCVIRTEIRFLSALATARRLQFDQSIDRLQTLKNETNGRHYRIQFNFIHHKVGDIVQKCTRDDDGQFPGMAKLINELDQLAKHSNRYATSAIVQSSVLGRAYFLRALIHQKQGKNETALDDISCVLNHITGERAKQECVLVFSDDRLQIHPMFQILVPAGGHISLPIRYLAFAMKSQIEKAWSPQFYDEAMMGGKQALIIYFFSLFQSIFEYQNSTRYSPVSPQYIQRRHQINSLELQVLSVMPSNLRYAEARENTGDFPANTYTELQHHAPKILAVRSHPLVSGFQKNARDYFKSDAGDAVALAIDAGDTGLLKELLKLHKFSEVWVKKNELIKACNPLNHAVLFGQLDMVKVILDLVNVDWENRDESDRNCFQIAAQMGEVEIFKLLYERYTAIKNDWNLVRATPNSHGFCLSDFARWGGDDEIIKSSGVRDVLEPSVETGTLPDNFVGMLHRIYQNDIDFFNNLTCIDGIYLDDTFKSRTPLITEAASLGRYHIVMRLLDLGVDVNAKNAKGELPIHWAIWNSGRYNEDPNDDPYLQTVKVLVARGADLTASNDFGQTALHCACRCKNKSVTHYVFDRLAKLGSQDHCFPDYLMPDIRGWTPAHYAAQHGNDAALDRLIARVGIVCMDSIDLLGRNPMFLAETIADRAIAKKYRYRISNLPYHPMFPEPGFFSDMIDLNPQALPRVVYINGNRGTGRLQLMKSLISRWPVSAETTGSSNTQHHRLTDVNRELSNFDVVWHVRIHSKELMFDSIRQLASHLRVPYAGVSLADLVLIIFKSIKAKNMSAFLILNIETDTAAVDDIFSPAKIKSYTSDFENIRFGFITMNPLDSDAEISSVHFDMNTKTEDRKKWFLDEMHKKISDFQSRNHNETYWDQCRLLALASDGRLSEPLDSSIVKMALDAIKGQVADDKYNLMKDGLNRLLVYIGAPIPHDIWVAEKISPDIWDLLERYGLVHFERSRLWIYPDVKTGLMPETAALHDSITQLLTEFKSCFDPETRRQNILKATLIFCRGIQLFREVIDTDTVQDNGIELMVLLSQFAAQSENTNLVHDVLCKFKIRFPDRYDVAVEYIRCLLQNKHKPTDLLEREFVNLQTKIDQIGVLPAVKASFYLLRAIYLGNIGEIQESDKLASDAITHFKSIPATARLSVDEPFAYVVRGVSAFCTLKEPIDTIKGYFQNANALYNKMGYFHPDACVPTLYLCKINLLKANGTQLESDRVSLLKEAESHLFEARQTLAGLEGMHHRYFATLAMTEGQYLIATGQPQSGLRRLNHALRLYKKYFQPTDLKLAFSNSESSASRIDSETQLKEGPNFPETFTDIFVVKAALDVIKGHLDAFWMARDTMLFSGQTDLLKTFKGVLEKIKDSDCTREDPFWIRESILKLEIFCLTAYRSGGQIRMRDVNENCSFLDTELYKKSSGLFNYSMSLLIELLSKPEVCDNNNLKRLTDKLRSAVNVK